jgi:hypothetical protein
LRDRLFQLFEIDVHPFGFVLLVVFLFPDVMPQRVGERLEFRVPTIGLN